MNYRRMVIFCGCMAVLATVLFGGTAFRSARAVHDAANFYKHIKYLVDSGDSISTVPADTALSAGYLEIIFGDNPELLRQLLEIIEKNMKNSPDMSLGEVASIIVTYRKGENDTVEDVVAHIIGEFPLGRRIVGMHPAGYMANRMDANLWNTGQSAIRFLGRDIAVWAKDETTERPHQEIIEAIFAGEILLVAKSIEDKPLHYTAVFPAPRDVVPMRMRAHVRAMLMTGYIEPKGGNMELVILCNNERSAERVEMMVNDIFDSTVMGIQTRFGGTVTETAWSDSHIEVWWAYEFAQTIEKMGITRQDRTVSMNAGYERQMVNAFMKIIERFGRDYTAIRGVQDEKIYPLEVQDFMQGNRYTPRWTEPHKWGPDWPFGPSAKVESQPVDDSPEPVAEDSTPEIQ